METVQYYSLKEFFLDTELTCLEIPDYQRAFSWEPKQINDLKEDIEHIVKMSSTEHAYQHFAGTIIINRNGDRSGVFDIVDGQQRITTLLVLLSAINASGVIKDGDIENTYFRKGVSRKFISNAIDDVFFRSFVLERQDDATDQSKSHLLLKEAFTSFSKWLEHQNMDKIDILEAIQNNLKFIIYCAESSEEIGLMFESINNRGRPLSELDKVKNYLLYLTKKHDISDAVRVIKDGWRKISYELNSAKFRANEDEDMILRNVVIAAYDPRSKRNLGETDYSIIKEHIKFEQHVSDEVDVGACRLDLYKKINHFVGFLEHSCRAFAKLRRAENSLSDKDSKRFLTYLNCHDSIASILPLYFAVSEKAPKIERLKLLELIEKLNFRVYCLPGVTRRSDSNQATLFRWAHKVYSDGIDCYMVYKSDDKGSSTDEDIQLSLKDAIIRFTKDRCSQKKILLHLTIDDDEDNEDYYRWNNIKYFLSRYEEYIRPDEVKRFNVFEPFKSRGKNSRSNDKFSIEHFWAKKYIVPSKIKIKPQKRSQQLRRLGNLVLFPRGDNSSLNNISPEKKLKELKKKSELNKLQQIVELNKVYSAAEAKARLKTNYTSAGYYTYLFMALNDIRETKMLHAALNIWGFEDESTEIIIFERIDSIDTESDNCHIVPNLLA